MSASDHVSPQQWITVHHASDYSFPPHRINRPDDLYDPYTNTHPDSIHMGTVEASSSLNRRYLHSYQIPASHVYPVAFGDEQSVMNSEDDRFIQSGLEPEQYNFGRAMRGKQQGLFETVPMDPELAITTKMAVPYRNFLEDRGSISYNVPKSIIQKNATTKNSPLEEGDLPVKYLGVWDNENEEDADIPATFQG